MPKSWWGGRRRRPLVTVASPESRALAVPPGLPVMLRVAVLCVFIVGISVLAGMKWRDMVQLAPAASLLGQKPPRGAATLKAKSLAPPRLITGTAESMPPVLVRVK